jgi:hypothetical protein
MACAAPTKMPERWNFVTIGLGDDASLQRLLDVLKQSKECGCTHILLPDGLSYNLSENRAYLARVQKVKRAAKQMNLTIVPSVFALGYSGRYIGGNPNLAAGLPVKDMPFVVAGKSASADPALALDTSTLKPSAVGIDGKLKARPFTHYRLRFVKKGKYEGDMEEMVRITTCGGKRWVSRRVPDIYEQDGKTIIETTFNTLELTGGEMRVRIDVLAEVLKIEPAGALMIVRRGLTPLTVASADGKTIYEEGKDFKPLADPQLTFGDGHVFRHEPPTLELTADSRIRDGDKLSVSFFHAYRLGSDQDGISLEDPQVFQLMERDIANCAKVWDAGGYFMNYDEIRIGGWENPSIKPGKLLANHIRRACALVRKHAPHARLYTWSDMFCPGHNAYPFGAKGYYYLVNGNWDGSWEGLPGDVIILNWYDPDGRNIKFFADRGHSQVLCGYYDGVTTEKMKENIAVWMKVSTGAPHILGLMYTTWEKNYKNMNEYFRILDSYFVPSR